MTEKQSSATEIQWTMVKPSINAGEQANRLLSQALPPDVATHFATMRIANNRYIWLWKYDAIPLSKASPEVADAALVALDNLRQRIKGKIKDRMPIVDAEQCTRLEECILTCPSEDYIFCYQDANGQTDVIITGWGFVSRKNIDINPWKKVITKPVEDQDILVGFQQDGEPLPARQFTLTNKGAVNTFVTDGNGYYRFEKPFNIGTQLTVTDLKTNKSFDIMVMKGEEEHIFDVTIITKITVRVHKGDIPAVGEQVKIEGGDHSFSLVTDEQGECTQTVTFVDDKQVTATWGEKQERQSLSKSGNIFIFEIQQESPIEEPPPLVPLSACVKVIDQNGNPVPEYPIILESSAGVININTDVAGHTFTPPLVEGDKFIARDGNNPDWYQEYVMSGQEAEYVLMINYEPPRPVMNARVRVIDCNNIFVTNVPVTFSQQGMPPVEAYIDENGDCVVDKALFIPDAPIQVLVNDPNRQFPPIMFSMSNDENDYLLAEENNTPWWLILIEVLIALGVAVGLFFLCKAYLAGASGISDLVH